MNQALDGNQYFSWARWSRLVALHWDSHKRRYLLALPAIAGLQLAWGSFLLVMDKYSPLDDGMQAFTFYWGLAAVGCLYSSTIFAEFGSRAQGIAWLSVPASTLEKLFCGFLFSGVLYFLFYTFVFYLTDIPLVEIGNQLIIREHRTWQGGYPISPNPVWNVVKGIPGENLDHVFHIFLVVFFVLQSAFALGSVYFNRFAFIKTLIAVLLFLLGFVAIQKVWMENMLPSGWHRYPPFQDWVSDGDTLKVRTVRLPEWITGPVGLFLLLGIPPLLWIVTYFRIKEKEV